ncbi:helix-turn-helix domain-containing protein [Niallia sp. FSL W8-0177]|uniref:helix-turn-helix domain-containing protein n=1 Tax=Niallia sp. FSL W8-0177 TaxID=2954522 RepID=UPI0030F6253E
MDNTRKYTTWESLPDTLTALHIAQFLGISRRRVYELFLTHVEHGGIPNFAIGTSKRVEKSDFKKWIIQLKKKSEVNQ